MQAVTGITTQEGTSGDPDRNLCRLGRSSKGELPLRNVYFLPGYPQPSPGSRALHCNFAPDRIDTPQQLAAWMARFQTHDENARQVLQNVCSQKDGKRTIGWTNPICQQWLAAASTADRDAYSQFVCGQHPDLEECRCVNRSQDKLYQGIDGARWGNDGCWWRPCQDPEKYHIPSTVAQAEYCPQSCRQILTIAGNLQNLTIQDFQQSIACDFSSNQNRYECISGVCRATPDGQYETPNCNGMCTRLGWTCVQGACAYVVNGSSPFITDCMCEGVEKEEGDAQVKLALSTGIPILLFGMSVLIYRLVSKRR